MRPAPTTAGISAAEVLRRPPGEGYARLAKATGLDLVRHPDLVNDPARFLECGVADFILCGCLPFAKADDVLNVTRRLNGGTVGLAQRQAWLAKWKAALGSAPIVLSPAPAIPRPAPVSPAPPPSVAPPSMLARFIAALVAAFRRK
jgi:putative chitinase